MERLHYFKHVIFISDKLHVRLEDYIYMESRDYMFQLLNAFNI